MPKPEGRDGVSPARQRRVQSKMRARAASAATRPSVMPRTDTQTQTTQIGCVSHTYTLNLLHVVFSTKNREPLIHNLDGLIKNLRGIARNKNIDILAAGGTENHIHLLLRIPPTRPVSESIRDLKANSSRYMSETSGHFAWQDGYAAISVSPSQVNAVRAYIDGQAQHHAKRTYEQEIAALLDKSGVPYERAYFAGCRR
jgi:putative transposase